MIHLATGIVMRDSRLLMVASRYPNQAQPLWNLPGGRQLSGELLCETVLREVYEETGLSAHAREIAYLSESYDGAQHFLNVTFVLSLDPAVPFRIGDALPAVPQTSGCDHVVAVEWVPLDEVGARIVVPVVRDPLVAYLRGTLTPRYAGFHEAGITIEWPEDSR